MKQKILSSNVTSSKHTPPPIAAKTKEKVMVTIHIPEAIAENLKQQKINRIYDILNPEISQ